MTFPELLELLVSRVPLSEPEMRDAKALIHELRELNAFGVVLGTTEKQDHVCTSASRWGTPLGACKYCGKVINV